MASLTNENTSQSDVDNNDIVRIQAKEEWLKTVPKIVEKTRHPHALQIMSYLASSAAGAPYPDGCRALERKRAGDVFLVPILFQQDQCCPIWQGLIQDSTSIGYFIRPDIIMLRHTIPCSSLWRGLILLHEASHAYQCINNHGEMSASKAEEECRVFDFENRIIEMMFGESYNKIMRKAIAVLKKEKCVTQQCLRISTDPLELFTEDLEKLYGPPYSDEERELRRTTFITHVYFSFFSKYYSGSTSRYLKKRFAELVLTPKVPFNHSSH